MSETVPDLRADCSRCAGLCCVALPFSASADFAVDKDAGDPCGNLRPDFRCGIHSQLREKGYPGCTVFDCYGAGQQVTEVTFGGADWRDDARTAGRMFRTLPVMRQLHELLFYVTLALDFPGAEPLRADLGATRDALAARTRLDPDALAALDLPAVHAETAGLLLQVSERVRAGAVPGRRADHRGADLIGASLRGADLRGASLRGARLIAADLRGADLHRADVIGADFRDTRLEGADLTGCLFLTQSQLDAAKGDLTTKLPAILARPDHWRAA
ncbi:pentapeptide repeat-containing protein [Streptomyces sp. A7024]|uniref:Pentapeptide repeat-containing protein n=1 Tax=Streptomyces coryli TaxID=1128680 RepID=A0A6G4TX66_9ACTN|nr:pentapeptide repeat-containing protein [Streptomyces coryli]